MQSTIKERKTVIVLSLGVFSWTADYIWYNISFRKEKSVPDWLAVPTVTETTAQSAWHGPRQGPATAEGPGFWRSCLPLHQQPVARCPGEPRGIAEDMERCVLRPGSGGVPERACCTVPGALSAQLWRGLCQQLTRVFAVAENILVTCCQVFGCLWDCVCIRSAGKICMWCLRAAFFSHHLPKQKERLITMWFFF